MSAWGPEYLVWYLRSHSALLRQNLSVRMLPLDERLLKLKFTEIRRIDHSVGQLPSCQNARRLSRYHEPSSTGTRTLRASHKQRHLPSQDELLTKDNLFIFFLFYFSFMSVFIWSLLVLETTIRGFCMNHAKLLEGVEHSSSSCWWPSQLWTNGTPIYLDAKRESWAIY